MNVRLFVALKNYGSRGVACAFSAGLEAAALRQAGCLPPHLNPSEIEEPNSPLQQRSYGDACAISVIAADFARGSLHLSSFPQPGKLFTAHTSLVAGQIGELQPAKSQPIHDAVVRMIQKG